MAKKDATTETVTVSESAPVAKPLARKKGDTLTQKVIDPKTGEEKQFKCKVIKEVRQEK